MIYIWNLQSDIGHGHTILGVISALDKTLIMIGTGKKEMHPAHLLLANIISGVWMKPLHVYFPYWPYPYSQMALQWHCCCPYCLPLPCLHQHNHQKFKESQSQWYQILQSHGQSSTLPYSSHVMDLWPPRAAHAGMHLEQPITSDPCNPRAVWQ